jgi:hypothetical protein
MRTLRRKAGFDKFDGIKFGRALARPLRVKAWMAENTNDWIKFGRALARQNGAGQDSPATIPSLDDNYLWQLSGITLYCSMQ